jgi:protoporphyrinogen/coproporphyrinogen III oxidase
MKSNDSSMPEFVIIGAGISGLTVAHALAKAGKDVIVLESSGNIGGKIVTERIDGYLLEAGPNSLRVENQETVDLIEECGLSSRAIEANPNSNKRYILKNGEWMKIPSNPGEAISTSLFSFGSKLRILAEPFILKTKLDDESAASFISRRLGKEIFDYAADPFISGIYAGDPHKLSMRYAFPSMWRAEQDHGSLIKGMMKGRRKSIEKKVRTRVISFPGGLSELIIALRTSLSQRLHMHDGALKIDRSQKGFVVISATGTFESKKIIFAMPAYDLAAMLQSITPDLSKILSKVNYPPVAVVYLGYNNDQFAQIPEGFGGLIPSKENRKILGVIFSSSNFPNRAPDGHSLLTILMGGARNPEIAEWPDKIIIETAVSELSDLLKPNGAPRFHHLRLWKRAIPQYNVGYGAVLGAIEQAEQNNPGLHFIGNYRGGISVGACIQNATELGNRLV